ncbi:tetraspanin-1 [Gadus chalcogrammus]|uniref:tetraspanin-1 n=1 Tax=Gadus chalcogrammus TaxID=1042646 RepID=UPI0024C4B4FD|nr:tetraspanin-1 [Gadus chalcogrammus]
MGEDCSNTSNKRSNRAEGILRAWATPALKEQYGNDPVVTKIWNTTMTELKCCGFTNYTDFEDSRFTRDNNGSLPEDCCLGNGTYCSPQHAPQCSLQGCFEELLELVQTNADVVGGVAAGIGAMEIAAMVVSIYLYCHLDNRETIKA